VSKGFYSTPRVVEVHNSSAPCCACMVYVVNYRVQWLGFSAGFCDSCVGPVRSATKKMSRLCHRKHEGKASPLPVKRVDRWVVGAFCVGVGVGVIIRIAMVVMGGL
jgi:hypothetical protein